MAENGKKLNDKGQGKPQRNDSPPPPPLATEVRTSDPMIAASIAGPPAERAGTTQSFGSSRSPDDERQRPCDEGQSNGQEEDQKTAGRWLSVHAGRDVYVSSGGEGQRRGEEGEKKQGDEREKKQGEEGQKKQGEEGQKKQGEKKQGTQQAKTDASKNEAKQGDREQKSYDENDHKRQKSDRHDQERRHKQHGRLSDKKEELKRTLPRWPTLLIVCILAFVCGVGGAWGYSALFGSSTSEDQDKGSDKGGQSSEKGGGSDKSGGGKSGGSGSDQSSDVNDLKQNLEDLDDGITQLTARLDRLTESIQESRLPIPEYFSGTSRIARMSPAGEEAPPILPNALPTQLNVLARKVEQMTDLPARVKALEELIAVLQEEIKMLNERHVAP